MMSRMPLAPCLHIIKRKLNIILRMDEYGDAIVRVKRFNFIFQKIFKRLTFVNALGFLEQAWAFLFQIFMTNISLWNVELISPSFFAVLQVKFKQHFSVVISVRNTRFHYEERILRICFFEVFDDKFCLLHQKSLINLDFNIFLYKHFFFNKTNQKRVWTKRKRVKPVWQP